jgi:hypothetical protein
MSTELAAQDVIRDKYLSESKSSLVIAAEIGRSKFWVLTQLRKMGIVRARKDAFALSDKHGSALRRSGPQCHQWKGGRKVGGGGYVQLMRKGHPSADRFGYVMEHRLVMEELIGRFLETREHVHHINGIKSDNRPENLRLVDRSEHMALHANIRPRTKRGTFSRENA